MFKHPHSTTRQKQLQLINGFVTQHDYLCCCDQPAFHCMIILCKQLSSELTDENKKQIIQCLGTTDTATATGPGDAAEELGLEDLEKLFATEDTPEETG